MLSAWGGGRALALVEEAKPPLAPSPAKHRRGRHKRGRSWHSVDSLADLAVALSPAEAAERLLEHALTAARLAFRLWSYLGLGWKWLLQAHLLCLYAFLLMPGFLQMVVYYFFSPRVTRDIRYGRKPRQALDLYVPDPASRAAPAPVVVFVTGGAWTIGYKAWGAMLARRLCDAGVMVACLDYVNAPQGSALQMVEDVNAGIAWVTRRIARYGGDPEAVHLVGQSAGGQLALLALLNQAAQAASGEAVLGAAPVWHTGDIASFIGVSGAYDLEGLAEHLHRRGLYRALLDSIMSIDGATAYASLSPLAVARSLAGRSGGGDGGCDGGCASERSGGGGGCAEFSSGGGSGGGSNSGSSGGSNSGSGSSGGSSSGSGGGSSGSSGGSSGGGGGGAGRFLPPSLLLHGDRDKSVPHQGSAAMAEALRALGVPCTLQVFPGKTHTDLLLEDAFRGGRDLLADTIVTAVTGRPHRSNHARMVPAPLVWLAGRVCPF